jgi:hypothetical protein
MNKRKLLKFKIKQRLVNDFVKCYLIILLSLMILSCNHNKCENIGGIWVIKEMTVDKKNFVPYLYLNTFGFHCEDNSAYFHASYFFEDDKLAKWEIIEKGGQIESIIIKSKIKIYNNNFKVKLEKLEKTKQFHLVLTSNNVYISAYKIIDDY